MIKTDAKRQPWYYRYSAKLIRVFKHQIMSVFGLHSYCYYKNRLNILRYTFSTLNWVSINSKFWPHSKNFGPVFIIQFYDGLNLLINQIQTAEMPGDLGPVRQRVKIPSTVWNFWNSGISKSTVSNETAKRLDQISTVWRFQDSGIRNSQKAVSTETVFHETLFQCHYAWLTGMSSIPGN
jgi:hypothetical protein